MNAENVRAIRPAQVASLAEGQLIGALCELGDQARELLEVSGLTDDDLLDVRARCAWRVIRMLVHQGKIVSPATVFSAGKSYGLFAEIDGPWLASLAAANTLTRDGFVQVCGDLQRGVLGRGIATDLDPVLRSLRLGDYSVAQAIAKLDQAAVALSKLDAGASTAARDVLDQAENWERRERTGTTPGVLTHVKVLDKLTTPNNGVGGYPPKFGVVVGNPSVGKNVYLAGSIRAQLTNEPDLVIGGAFLEDASRWLVKRWTALDLGIPLNAVGVVRLSDEQRAKLRDLEPRYHELLKRVHVFNYRRIRPPELVHLFRVWIHRYGCRMLYLDDFNHLDHKPNPYSQRRQFFSDKRNEQVADAAEALAELADRREVPIIATAHTKTPESEKDYHRPPRLDEIADTSMIGKIARFAIGLWRTKSRVLRVTVLKNTEGPGLGETLELDEFREAAVLDVEGGRQVNLDQENREEREARKAEADAESIRRALARKAALAQATAKAKAEAEKNKPPEPQLDLLGGKPA